MFLLKSIHKNDGKIGSCTCAHGGASSLEVVFTKELKIVHVENASEE